MWVEFSYEQLPIFYFYCGLVGYSEKSCSCKITDSQNGQVCERQYGEWLRVKNIKAGKLADRLVDTNKEYRRSCGTQENLGKELMNTGLSKFQKQGNHGR